MRSSIKPRSAYLARLSEDFYFKKLQEQKIAPEVVQKVLLEQLNKVLECCYRGEEKLNSWLALSALAQTLGVSKSRNVINANSSSSTETLDFGTEADKINDPSSAQKLVQPDRVSINIPELKQNSVRRPKSKRILLILGRDLGLIFTVTAVLITAALFSEVPYGPTKGSLEVIDGLTLSSTSNCRGDKFNAVGRLVGRPTAGAYPHF